MIPTYQEGLLEQHTYVRLADNEAQLQFLRTDVAEEFDNLRQSFRFFRFGVIENINKLEENLKKAKEFAEQRFIAQQQNEREIQLRAKLEIWGIEHRLAVLQGKTVPLQRLEKLEKRIEFLENREAKLLQFNKRLGQINIDLLEKIRNNTRIKKKSINKLTKAFEQLQIE